MNKFNIFYMTFKDQLDSLRVDAHVYWSKRGEGNLLNHLLYVITCHGWHVMFWFRVGKIIYSVPIPVVSHILKIIFQINWFFITTFYGIWLDASNNIGKGFYIGHFGGIIVRGDFGDYCSIGQGVTIGSKGAGKSNGCPVFNDNIYVGAGAKIIGKIVIGSGTVVGANAVVTASTPANSLAVGIPAKIIVRDLT